ncbi:Gfo/Idh/MocA family protein [Streptomyces sulphureus]|uniref:Gfo/Idh/MocA family protein n=1 Tax=Streptomyces sulphureus TaxID=47758 RepID=UPI00037D2179|nr:Gfo/Idh/MocA family oxidoreductase [Streptomyces sulphureus]
MTDRIRFGLLGTGAWAARTHGPALAAHPDVDLVGVWGRRPDAAEELATALEARAYATPDALFTDCDAVAVALPPDVQAPLAARAAAAGCHLLLDKPVATTSEGAAAVTGALRGSGAASVVFFTLRFGASAAWIDRQAARQGWMAGRADWLSDLFGGVGVPYETSPWRYEKGALWDLGPHALSVLVPVLGAVEEVRAMAGPGDAVQLSTVHASGAVGSSLLSHSLPPGDHGAQVELHGAAGHVALPESQDGAGEAYLRAVDALLAAAGGGPRHPCDAFFAEDVTRVLVRAEAELAR